MVKIYSLWKPFVDVSHCKGCARCIAACQRNVFEIRIIDIPTYKRLGWFRRMKIRHNGMQVAYAIRTEDCQCCGQCLKVCRERAIQQRNIGHNRSNERRYGKEVI